MAGCSVRTATASSVERSSVVGFVVIVVPIGIATLGGFVPADRSAAKGHRE